MITAERLREVLNYDPETGVFTWRPRMGRGGDAKGGKVAGTIRNAWRYRRIQIDGAIYNASALAILYVTGTLPFGQIDHRDRDTTNDAYENLRPATQSQNKANSGVYKNNRLGVKGVRLHRNGRYEARLRVGGALLYLGCYRTIKEAKAVYDAAAQAAFGEFARSA